MPCHLEQAINTIVDVNLQLLTVYYFLCKYPFCVNFKLHGATFVFKYNMMFVDLPLSLISHTVDEKEELYGTRHQEAVKIFNALLSQENLADPIKQVQSVLQKCFDIQDLQSEVTPCGGVLWGMDNIMIIWINGCVVIRPWW